MGLDGSVRGSSFLPTYGPSGHQFPLTASTHQGFETDLDDPFLPDSSLPDPLELPSPGLSGPLRPPVLLRLSLPSLRPSPRRPRSPLPATSRAWYPCSGVRGVPRPRPRPGPLSFTCAVFSIPRRFSVSHSVRFPFSSLLCQSPPGSSTPTVTRVSRVPGRDREEGGWGTRLGSGSLSGLSVRVDGPPRDLSGLSL